MIPVFIGLLMYFQMPGGGPSSDHAFYLGVVRIDHEAAAATARIRIKVFRDDLRDALRNAFDEARTVQEDNLCEYPASLTDYFNRHLTCRINETPLSWQIDLCEQEGDVCLLTFIADCPSTWRSLELKGDFLMELFPAQVNVVSVNDGEEKRFFRLSRQKPKQEVGFMP